MNDNQTCSTCSDPAIWVVDGADESKGNRACDTCKRFWPLAQFRRIERDHT